MGEPGKGKVKVGDNVLPVNRLPYLAKLNHPHFKSPPPPGPQSFWAASHAILCRPIMLKKWE
jgi:hypothetical protein